MATFAEKLKRREDDGYTLNIRVYTRDPGIPEFVSPITREEVNMSTTNFVTVYCYNPPHGNFEGDNELLENERTWFDDYLKQWAGDFISGDLKHGDYDLYITVYTSNYNLMAWIDDAIKDDEHWLQPHHVEHRHEAKHGYIWEWGYNDDGSTPPTANHHFLYRRGCARGQYRYYLESKV